MGNLNQNWLNLCFVIDKSGSMYTSREDVIGGFIKTIDEQKNKQDFKVTVSLYTFNENVTEEYLGTDIKDVKDLEYNPDGLTAMNDGIGTAIDKVGRWLYEKDLKNEEMPAKTLFVVMTDGMENASKEYSLRQVRDKIKEQTEKYSWEFIYLGTDITTTKAADDLGFKFKAYGDRATFAENYDIVNAAANTYYNCSLNNLSLDDSVKAMCEVINDTSVTKTLNFEKKIGRKLSNT